jgi:hypothetical protein
LPWAGLRLPGVVRRKGLHLRLSFSPLFSTEPLLKLMRNAKQNGTALTSSSSACKEDFPRRTARGLKSLPIVTEHRLV